ncbi:MAG TPA: ATP-binding cassette domain-containing protein [Eoetvoesiella sp.]
MSISVQIKRNIVSGGRQFALDMAFNTARKRVALLGPSGSGKTLTVQAVAGLMRPDSGSIVLNGTVVFDSAARVFLPAQARKVAYLAQDYNLFPHLTVVQNICFGLKMGWRNPGRGFIPDEARRWIASFELESIVNSYPFEISGGQKQRVALARALAVRPNVLLLDEPLAALDATLKAKTRLELAALQQRLDIPMILITHDPDDALALADHVVEIGNGKVVDEFSPARLALR